MEDEEKNWFGSCFETMLGVAVIGLILFTAVLFMVPLDEIDWRDTVTIQLDDDNTFNLVDNGTMVGTFNGTHHDLVPGDKIILGTVPFTHLSTQSSTSCTSGWDDDYDSMSQDCWTTYWDVIALDVGGMNFSIYGDQGFMHTCFNAFCNVTATVDGDDYWGLDMYAGRLSITVQEFDWVRWCQGEEICE